MRPVDLARRATFEAATLCWRFPAVVLPVSRALRHGVVVDDATDLVVEGFPRSGNSLAVAAIAAAQPEPIRIAHHVHAPAHVLEAVRRRTPVLLVIREPGAAADALLESKPFLSVDAAVRGWLRFHEPLLAVRGRVVVATWDQVHDDLAGVVERLNARFATTLTPPSADVVARADPERHFAERERRGLPLVGRTAPERQASARRPAAVRPLRRARRVFGSLTSSS